jgi:hypothetical protein
MSLDGDQAQKLHDAIVSGFDRPNLEQLVRFGLNERLDRISPDSRLDTVVFNLIQWADQEGRTAELIQAVQRARPNVPEIQAIAEALLAAGDRSTGRPRSRWMSKRGDRNRTAMIEKVRAIWIDGFLKQSLFREVRILLGLNERPEAVMRPFDLLVQRPDQGDRPLPAGMRVLDVYDSMDQSLLILGAPGAGKSTLLLELASDLLDRATREPAHPIPVVLPLSTWAASRKPLVKWLVDELNLRYDVPHKLAQEGVASDQVLPLLDGLDEVKAEHRAACVEAINEFRQSHGLLPLVITSRTADYEALVKPLPVHGVVQERNAPSHLAQHLLGKPLRLQGAILVQPLTHEQVNAYLTDLGPSGEPVRAAIHEDSSLWDLLDSPLMLNVVAVAYAGQWGAPPLESGTVAESREQMFNSYVNKMLGRRAAEQDYTAEQTVRWLSWLADQMAEHSQTFLHPLDLRFIWLPGWIRWIILVSRSLGCAVGFSLSVSTYVAMLACVFLAPSFRPTAGTFNRSFVWLFCFSLGGLIGGLLGGLLDSLLLHRNALFVSAVVGLFAGLLLPWLVVLFGLLMIILYILVVLVGCKFIPWVSFRLWLIRQGFTPRNYVRFLDHAADRLLLRKVGGGYVFIHRMLLDYFAARYVEPSSGDAPTVKSSSTKDELQTA